MGYDPDDFVRPPPVHEDSAFRIVHTGFMHTQAGLRHRRTGRLRKAMGGLYMPVDILPRSHMYLLQALHDLLSRDPRLASEVEVHLAGVPTEDDRRLAAESKFVRFPGFLSHDESVALIRSADLLFLPMHMPLKRASAGLVRERHTNIWRPENLSSRLYPLAMRESSCGRRATPISASRRTWARSRTRLIRGRALARAARAIPTGLRARRTVFSGRGRHPVDVRIRRRGYGLAVRLAACAATPAHRRVVSLRFDS